MCGIIAVVRRPSDRPVPDQHDILAGIERAAGLMPETPDGWPEGFGQAAGLLAEVDGLLRGLPGLRCLLADPGGRRELDRLAEELERRVERLESRIDAEPASVSPDALEAVNASLVRAKDSLWAIRRDRIASAEAVAAFAGPTPSPAVVETFTSIQIALAALDRLEVRGRDSAGVHVLVTGHRLDLDQPEIARLLDPRLRDPLFTSWALRTPAGHLSFVYKAASEVGELGDNGRRLRAAIAGDELLRRALQAEGARAVVLAHTRWASVGLINQANAHPLNQEEEGGIALPYAVAALNGDIDNHLDLVARHRLSIPSEITTDAKVIPVLLARRLDQGLEPAEAFRRTVIEFEGSFAIAAQTATAPGQLLLGVRGSGWCWTRLAPARSRVSGGWTTRAASCRSARTTCAARRSPRATSTADRSRTTC